MISSSNINVIEVLKIFKSKKIDVSFLVPTSTGLQKSIMDATQIVQQFLKEKNIIDYNEITKGDKIFIKTLFYFEKKLLKQKHLYIVRRPRMVIQEYGYIN
jgi:hypothetical protein